MSIPIRLRVWLLLVLSALFVAWGFPAVAGDLDEAIREGDVATVQSILAKNPAKLDVRNDEGLTPVNLAAREGKTEIVKELLHLGADMSIGDFENSTPIHNAAVGGYVDTVEVLLDAGAAVDERDDNEMTALLFAVSYNNTALVRYLIEKGADVNAKNNNGFTPILTAVIRANVPLIECLLENGADVNVRADGGFTPLHSAASYGNFAVVKTLVEHGADIQARDDRGSIPLHWALNPNTYEVAKLFLEKGASATLRDGGGRTPLHGVAQRGSVNVAELLLEHGAEIDAVDEQGITPIAIAASGKLEMVEFLLAKGAKLLPERSGAKPAGTPLHFAVLGGNLDTARFLLEKGVDVDALDPDGRSTLRIAIRHGTKEMVELLLASGAKIDEPDPSLGRTELHMAAASGQLDVAKLLLERGAARDVKDSLGKTPFEYACDHGYAKLASVLANEGKAGKVPNKAKKPEVAQYEPILAKCTKKGEACVFFLGHSGWAIKTPKHFLVFDYFLRPDREDPSDASLVNGRIVAEELQGENVYVFASHEHGDHFHEGIFEWRKTLPQIRYVLGMRPRSAPCEYTYLPPRSEQVIGDVRVTTIDSNDAGVGFLVEVDGLAILHMGDHANRSEEPGPERDEFRREIDFLAEKGIPIDLAFFPVSGCGFGLPESVAAGVAYAVEKLRPKIVCPMHAGDMTDRLRLFADRYGKALGGAKVVAAVDRGDRFHFAKEAKTN